MPRNLGSESWTALCDRVAATTGGLSWRWAAIGRENGEWNLIALVIEAGSQSVATQRIDRYARAIVAVEELDAETAAQRLRAFTASADGEEPQVRIAEQGNAVPHLVYSGEEWGLTPGGWPRLVVEAGGGSAAYADPSEPLSAVGMPFYPSLGQAVAERIFRLPYERVRLNQLAPLSVRLIDRRGRIAALGVVGESLSVRIEEGVEGALEGFYLQAAWRAELSDEDWSRTELPVSGQQTLTLPTEGIPAEFVAALVDSDGEEVDRHVFDRRHHVPTDSLETLEASIGRWIEEGEHARLEYKRELSEKANLSFAETVAAFANGAGGVILIGVDDRGTAVGWRSRKPVDQITNIVADLVDEIPAIEVDEIVIDDRPIVVVRVPPSPAHRRPHLVRGRAMVRINATTRAASAAQHRELTAGF